MEQVSINKDILLSEHFTLGEVCKTKHKTADGNIPSHVAIENLTRICRDWLEDLRYSYNMLYGEEPAAATREGQAPLCSASSAQDGASPCVSPNEVPVRGHLLAAFRGEAGEGRPERRADAESPKDCVRHQVGPY